MRVEAILPKTSAVAQFVYTKFVPKKMIDLENEDQGHGVEYSQWCQSMANINLVKSPISHFCESSHYFRNINILHFPP